MKYLELREVTVRDKPDWQGLDFVVSGRSLLIQLRKRGICLIPRILPGLTPIDAEFRDLLLLETEGDMKSGRVALYINAYERDPEYWSVGPRIERDGKDIIWYDFAEEEPDYFAEDGMPDFIETRLDRIGPFRFREDDYRRAISVPGRPIGS